MITISIDAMGGDHGLDTTIPAVGELLSEVSQVKLVLVGDESRIHKAIDRHRLKDKLDNNQGIIIHHASEVVEMDENPATALRRKKDSSMRVAINLVKDGQADGCVSAGNTGALMATARFVLSMLPGIDRPAICGILPRTNGHTHMLDLGANVDTPPEILLQFGMMGTELVKCLDNKSNPKVGLLNIGVEEIKGNETIKATSKLFKESRLNYVGFVEADEIYLGNTDLVVCDGVLGNVALKASEGVAQMIMTVMKDEFLKNALTKISATVAKPVINSIKYRLDHRRYNGASLLGLNGTVVKSHGGIDALGFKHAVAVAIKEIEKNLVKQIQETLLEYNR